MASIAPGVRRCEIGIALLGLAVLLVGLFRPTENLPTQTALHPVRPQALAFGERLFNAGLVSHGLLLLGAALFCLLGYSSRWTRREGQPLYAVSAHPAENEGRAPLRLVLLILVVGVGVRLIGLNSGLWYDEVVTLTEFVRLPFPELLRNYADQNQHPLYSILARGTVLLVGESPWAVRFPAVLFGVASLVVLYGFSRRVTSSPEPLLACALLAVSYQHVWFSQNARGYTGLLFWALAGSWLFLLNLERPNWTYTLGYAVVTALALYTHLTAAFIIAAQGIIYLTLLLRKGVVSRRLEAGDWLPLIGFALAGTLAFQLYALVLPQVLASFQKQTGGIRVQAWTDLHWGAAQVFQGLLSSFAGLIGTLIAGIVVAAGLFSYLRRNPVLIAFLVLPCVLGMGVMLLLNRHLYPRFFFPVFAFGILILVRGAMVLGGGCALLAQPESRPRLSLLGGTAFACCLILLSALSLPLCYRYPKQDYRSALAYIDAQRHPRDAVVVVGMAAIPVTRYYGSNIREITTAQQLDNVRAGDAARPIWLIYTFRDHMKSYHPDVLKVIDEAFVHDRSFPGTVGGGAVIVCRSLPGQASATQPAFVDR